MKQFSHLKFARRWFILACCSLSILACNKPPQILSHEVISTRPHDPSAFTQGLQLVGGRLFESTGQYGASTVREVDPLTGKILRSRALSAREFGEGLTHFKNELWVLTWKEQTVHVFDPDSLKPLRKFNYQGEGWGLTNDGNDLIMSNGSDVLQWMNASDFSVVRRVHVTDAGNPVNMLNELEWVNGEIFANIFMTERIARIDPKSGRVTGWLDLKNLRSQLAKPHRAEVLNGIAHDAKTGNFLITGKYWPALFEVQVR